MIFLRFSTCSIIPVLVYFVCPVPLIARLPPFGRSVLNLGHLMFALPLSVRPPRLLGARFCKVLWHLLTSWHIENESIPRSPPVRAFSFIQSLRNLHDYPFCVRWASDRKSTRLNSSHQIIS